MDAELDDNLRQRSIRHANRLLTDRNVADFIEIRFLKPVPQQTWDLRGAILLARAQKLPAVERLYAIVHGPLLLQLEDEISVWAARQGYTSVERAIAVEKGFATGLVAAVATTLHDGNQSHLRAKIGLARGIRWDPKLAAHLANRFAPLEGPPRLPPMGDEDETVEVSDTDVASRARTQIDQLLEEYRSRQRRYGHRGRPKSPGSEVLPAILKQINWIINRFEAGHFDAAWNDVTDLAKRQLADANPQKLAMSFTSLATRLVWHREVATKLCDLAALCAPDDPTVWTARAELLRKWGRLNEALAAYERTMADFPTDVVARNGHAETLRAMGRFDEALSAYARTMAEFPQNAYARNGRAETLRATGRFDEALAAYERTMTDFPTDVVARNGHAETLRAMGRFDEALAAYERTMAEFPQNAYARNGRAETLRAMGRFDEALTAYERTMADFPTDVVARNGHAETLRAMGRLDEALAAYERIMADFPTDVVARNGRAGTLRAMGRLDEALAAYERTMADFPTDVVARNGHAGTLRAMGRLDEALAAYERTMAEFPHNAVTRNGRVAILADLGEFSQARAALKNVASRPLSAADWAAVHILHMIDFGEGATSALVTRLEQSVTTCPYRDQQLYFETTLAVVRIASKRMHEARRSLTVLSARPELDVDERAALKILEAHAEAAEGNLVAARRSLAAASNIVPYEEFRLRQLRQEVEHRFGLELDASTSPIRRSRRLRQFVGSA